MPALNNISTSGLLPVAVTVGAGQMRRSEFAGGEGGKQYLIGGFSGASAEYAVDQFRDMANVDDQTLPDLLGQSLLGAGLSYGGSKYDSPALNAASRGVHMNVMIQSMQQLGLTAQGLAGGVNGGSGGGSNGGSDGSTEGLRRPSASRTGGSSMEVV